MIIEEFKQFKQVENKDLPLIPHFIIDDEKDFYVDPLFVTQMHGFKERHKDKYQVIVKAIIDRAIKNKKVIFVGDFENNVLEIPGYICLEITDITDPLKIFVEDKSRGSDYGD